MIAGVVWVGIQVLVAQNDVLRRMGDRFRPGGNPWTATQIVFLLTLMIGGLVVAWWLARKWRGDETGYVRDVNLLFDELVRAHRLTKEQRKALRRVAHGQVDIDAPVLFLLKERLVRAAEAESSAARRAVLEELVQRLFAEASEASASEADASAAPSDLSSGIASSSSSREPSVVSDTSVSSGTAG